MSDIDPQKMDISVQDLKFDQPVVNIGCHADNDIVITGEGILPFHAMVVLEEEIFQLMSLSPEAEIRLNGKLLEELSISLPENHRLEIGDYALVFQKLSPSGIHAVVSHTGVETSTLASQFALAEGESAILVNIITQQPEVYVDQRGTFEFEVINGGPIVARFFVHLQGIPEEWVEIEADVFNLNEGQREMVNVHITPPRAPTSTAGVHDLKFVVTSPNYPGFRVETPFSLVIQPFHEFLLGNLSPKQQRIRWRKKTGYTHLPITNLGNRTDDFSVTAIDDENGCSFDLWVSQELQLNRQATITIPAGHMVELPIQITPLKPAIARMRAKRYHYTTNVQIPEIPTSPQVISATAISVPLFGWWSILLGILMLLVGLFILFQPRINSFEVASGKDIIELGDTTKLEWSVSPFATRLSIDNLNDPITRSQKSMTVAPAQSTTYELNSGNWLSGLIGGDHKASQTVLVVPPSPDIGVFDVDKTTIDKGTPVNIRWSVTKADRVELDIDNVIYELPEGGFSGEQEYVLEKDALVTITAYNASGIEMRSHFINVEPPEITVNTFTVWAKQENAASPSSGSSSLAAKSGGGRLASKIYIPDPNFPVKLVELIPDPTASNGYRVEFHDVNRELAKGEQVMLEWNIGGVDNVLIAPFVDALPNIGVQPFFPQESMNFVMTAKSGEVEEIFMLPVKVFDGEPPEAPTIEFFEAAPEKMVGGGPVEFVWSVSGEWTRIQIATSDSIVADYLNAQGFETTSVTKTTTFILTAWNNDLSSSSPLEITVDPALLSIDLDVTDVNPKPLSDFLIGESIIVSIAFSSVPEDGVEPSGKVIVTDETATCEVALPAKTCTLTFTTSGQNKQISASYEGDDIYLPADSAPFGGYQVNVQSAQVDIFPFYYSDAAYTTPINDISTASLELNTNLYVKVEVRPENTLIGDDKGKINLNVCEEDPADPGHLLTGTCQFLSNATVKKQSNGSGLAEIAIQGFPESGKRILLYEYKHEDNAIDPEFTEHEITIDKLQIYLFANEICDTDALTNCLIGLVGTSKTATIIFEFKTLQGLTYAILPSSPPQPVEAAYALIPRIPGAPAWTCGVIGAATGGYQLVCTGEIKADPGKIQPMRLSYNDAESQNYYYIQSGAGVQNQDFDIQIKESTSVTIADLSAFTIVGVPFSATKIPTNAGEIDVIDSDGNPVAATGSMDLVGNDPSTAVFGSLTPANCVENSGNIAINSVGADCDVYFVKAGSVSFAAEYAGDTQYAASISSLTTLTIAKQDGITATWEYKERSSSPWTAWNLTQWQVGKELEIRIELGDTGFSHQVFANRDLLVNFGNAGGNCAVLGASNNNGFMVAIKEDTSTNQFVAEFSITCPDRGADIDIELGFAENDAKDLAFSSSTRTIESLSIIKNNMNTHLVLTRLVDNDKQEKHTATWYTYKLPEINDYQFHVDEKYIFEVELDIFAGKYQSSSDEVINEYKGEKVIVDLPVDMQTLVEEHSQNCSINTSNQLEIVLNKVPFIDIYKGSYNYVFFSLGGSCKVSFNNTSTSGDIKFSYEADNNYYESTLTISTLGVEKQTITISLSPSPVSGTKGGGNPEPVTITLTPQFSSTSLVPLNSANVDLDITTSTTACTLGATTRNGNREAEFTVDDAAAGTGCLGIVTVNYNGNNWFQTDTETVSVEFK